MDIDEAATATRDAMAFDEHQDLVMGGDRGALEFRQHRDDEMSVRRRAASDFHDDMRVTDHPAFGEQSS